MKLNWSINDVLRSISEDLSDIDTFEDVNYWYWTFQQILDQGGPELLEHVLEINTGENHHGEVNVEQRYIIMHVVEWDGPASISPDESRRKIKVPFELDDTIWAWYNEKLVPKWKEKVDPNLRPESHPLFFEDAQSPMDPYQWQATVTPVQEIKHELQPGVLDDVDDFIGGKEMWRVTLFPKHDPSKQLVGIINTNEYDIMTSGKIERDDFGVAAASAQHFIWAVYWHADEMAHGKPLYEPMDIHINDLMQLDGGGVEFMKYLADKEGYGKSASSSTSPKGWKNVGTHTPYEEPVAEGLGDVDEFQSPCMHWSCNERDDAEQFHIAHTESEKIAQDKLKDPVHSHAMMSEGDRLRLFRQYFEAEMDRHGYEQVLFGGVPDWVPKGEIDIKESLGDTDEFTSEELTAMDVVIAYFPDDLIEQSAPQHYAIEVAKKLVAENGYNVGQFEDGAHERYGLNRISRESNGEVRIHGRLEVSEDLMMQVAAAGGYMELEGYGVTLIMQMEGEMARHRGLDV